VTAKVSVTVLPLKAAAQNRTVGSMVLREPDQTTDVQEADAPLDEIVRFPRNPEAEAKADEFERQCKAEATLQFARLKDEAQALYGLTRGRVGVRSPEKWAELLEKAGDEIGNGRFIVRCLGAERYLDPEIVAVLVTFRQNLIAERPHATATDIMQIDAAIVGYFNMLRVQGWIGNLSLTVERQLFGQEPLNEIHGPRVGDQLEQQIGRLAEVILPLQERAAQMMARSLVALSPASRPATGRRNKRARA